MDDHNPRQSRGITLDGSRSLLLILFVLLLGRLVWRVAAEVRHASAPAGSQGLAAVDVRGRRVALSSPPRRIVSIAPATTEILFALGLKGRIVADTTYCDYPPEARSLPHIGDVNTSVEKVLAQRPDLVVGSASANSRAISAIERAGIRVFAVDPKTLPDTYAAILSLGRVTGQNAQAGAVVGKMKATAAATETAVARDPVRKKVLFVLQAEPLWVVGGHNFIDDVITLSGGDNIARAAPAAYSTLSPEQVVARRPDVIFVNSVDAPRIRRRAGWSTVPAVRNGAVYSLDPAIVSRPGPRLADAVSQMSRILHPRAFAPGR